MKINVWPKKNLSKRIENAEEKINKVIKKRQGEVVDDATKEKQIKLESNNSITDFDIEGIKLHNAELIILQEFNTTNKLFYKNSFEICAIANSDFDENIVVEFSLNSMDLICPYCRALHFCFEYTSDKLFSTCCSKGKIKLEEQYKFPIEIKNLCMDNFLHWSRLCNNKLAIASFTTKLLSVKGKGPPTIKICGQIYHNVSSLYPENNDKRNNGQLYILDNDLATNDRLNTINDDNDIHSKTLSMLDNLLRSKNPYVHSYKMMYEVDQEGIAKCKDNNLQKREIQMILTRHPHKDKNRYNIAACNEVAVVLLVKMANLLLQEMFAFTKNIIIQ